MGIEYARSEVPRSSRGDLLIRLLASNAIDKKSAVPIGSLGNVDKEVKILLKDKRIRKKGKVLVITGSQKVEVGVYRASDYNVSIGKQPHSEIAALAVFLDRLQSGKELEKKFTGARIVLGKKDEKK